MDKEKILKKINEQKEEQTKKYFNSVKKIVNKCPKYYSEKTYAKSFKDEN